jgi:hypothetical protein
MAVSNKYSASDYLFQFITVTASVLIERMARPLSERYAEVIAAR